MKDFLSRFIYIGILHSKENKTHWEPRGIHCKYRGNAVGSFLPKIIQGKGRTRAGERMSCHELHGCVRRAPGLRGRRYSGRERSLSFTSSDGGSLGCSQEVSDHAASASLRKHPSCWRCVSAGSLLKAVWAA